MISLSKGLNEIHLSLPRDCSEMGLLSMPQPAWNYFFPLLFCVHVFCNPSLLYGGYFRRPLILAITSMSKNPAMLVKARRK